MLTAGAGDQRPEQVERRAPASTPASASTAIAYSPATLTAPCRSSCAAARSATAPTAARAGAATAPAAAISARAPAGRAARARRRSARTRAPAAEPSDEARRRSAARPASVSGARRSSAAGETRAGRRARRPRLTPLTATAYGATRSRYQSGASSRDLDVRRSPARSNQRAVVGLAAGTASTCSASARATRLAGSTGPITSAAPPVAQDAVGLGDAALRVGPVLDATRPRRSGRTRRRRTAAPRRRRAACGRPASAGLRARARELVRALVEHRHARGVDARDDPLGGEARAGAGVEHLQVAARRAAPPPAPARASPASRTAG